MLKARMNHFDINDQGSVLITITNTVTGIEREIEVNMLRSGKVGDKSYQPSDRQLKYYGISREDWDNNILVYSKFWGGEVPVQQRYGTSSAAYFEDQLTYETALDILWGLTK